MLESNKRKVVILTGAGISAESGINTFRGIKDGLWENHKLDEVCSIEGWNKDKEKVLRFYNERRNDLKDKVPNKAHLICKELEKFFDITIITQNVDDLHFKAGSTKVIHLHGELNKSRSTLDESLIYECLGDMTINDKCEKGSPLRPHITFFNEKLDSKNLDNAYEALDECDVCIIVGTSMKVYPAAAMPFLTKHTCIIYYVDPSDVSFEVPKHRKGFFYHVKAKATDGMESVMNDLKDIYF